MVKKKIDNRIRVMIENGVKLGHRTMILLVGDKGRDQPDQQFYGATRIRMKLSAKWPQLYTDATTRRDFEALTPNLMARTIETVEGGGLIIFLLKSMDSLRQLHSITMDVHSRFKTEAHSTVVNRFNERFLLSLADNPRCLVLDDALNVLPISSKTAQHSSTHWRTNNQGMIPSITELIASLSDSPPAGPLVALCRTYEQATALIALIDTLADKQSRPPHCLTAARGRGKSACLGLSVAAAVALGYVNIYVTSPHPENLITLFEFVLKGLDTCLYQEHIDYNIVRSTNPDFKKAIYITPDDHSLLSAADLVLVDEAAAIPLVHVSAAAQKAPLALLSSTVSGYEGTGRALSLKLFAQLQNDHKAPPPLEEPIRYRAGDPVESWLNALLCLEAPAPSPGAGAPPPAACELFRNSPNDIQLLADAPAHCLFVLLAPTPPTSTAMPEVLCVIQMCLEGNISDKSVRDSLGRGRKAAGDLIPWNICEHFGLTEDLLKFWKSQKYVPVYLSNNELCLCAVLTDQLIAQHLSGHDLARLEAYSRQQADYRLITDLLAPVAELVFQTRAKFRLDAIQQLIAQHLSGHDLARLEAYSRQQADYRLITDLLAPFAEIVFHTRAKFRLDAIQQVC
ncbi:Uncharacterized protein OBRU01_00981 [Operophtera brumata]|uniref:18S rRNA cytosine acetyltransferase n=1 Tax=Operophtera brumata TaxID=104452 RepID=A0A0L7LTG3_OPEBR|nr:Uncharacterized protein OBRU01_00981 [Operophtera brumata]